MRYASELYPEEGGGEDRSSDAPVAWEGCAPGPVPNPKRKRFGQRHPRVRKSKAKHAKGRRDAHLPQSSGTGPEQQSRSGDKEGRRVQPLWRLIAGRRAALNVVKCDGTGRCPGLVHMRHCLNRYITEWESTSGQIPPDHVLAVRRGLVMLLGG